MIIDFHSHIFADEIAKKAIPTLAARSGKIPATDGTASDTEKLMKSCGVDKAVVLGIATKAKQTPIINDWLITLNNSKFFIPFGTVHPDYENKEAEIIKLAKAGIKGIKVHPDYQDTFANDSKMNEIYDLAQAHGLTVLFHAGVDIGLPDPVHCTPDMIVKIANNFPTLNIVAAHYGAYLMWDEVVEKYPKHNNIYIDTAFSVNETDKALREKIINAVGAEHVLLASDCPWENPVDSIKGVLKLNISEDSKEKILGKNAVKLLNI